MEASVAGVVSARALARSRARMMVDCALHPLIRGYGEVAMVAVVAVVCVSVCVGGVDPAQRGPVRAHA